MRSRSEERNVLRVLRVLRRGTPFVSLDWPVPRSEMARYTLFLAGLRDLLIVDNQIVVPSETIASLGMTTMLSRT